MRQRYSRARAPHSARRQIAEERRDIQHEQEVLNSTIRMDGVGEDPVIKALLQRLPAATNTEALDIALKLQQVVRGDASILSNPDMQEEIPRLREQMAKADKANQSYESDRERFIDEVFTRAEKIKPVGDARDRIIAKGVEQYQKMSQMAEAKRINKQLNIDWRIANDPKETIEVTGVTEMVKVNGATQTVIRPEVFRIFHRRIILQPGTRVVPKIVAERYREIVSGRELQAKRKKVLDLSKGHTTEQVSTMMRDLDKEYGTTSEFSKPGG